MSLTDTWLKSVLGKHRKKLTVETDYEGLGARLSVKGKITFQMRYRFAGKAARLDFGVYPKMTLKEARAENFRFRVCLDKGQDPKSVKELEKQKTLKADTLGEVFDAWYESDCIKRKETHLQIKRSFEIHVMSRLGKTKLRDITLAIWMSFLEELAASLPSISERVLTV